MHTIYLLNSGSQESNASNGAQIRVEMKKLEPLEADHTKLKANFAAYKITRWWLRNFTAITLWFRSLRNWPSAWCDRLPMALTSSFQLRFMHHLKRWIDDFTSFETTYSMHQMGSIKCSKSVQQSLSSWILHVRFLSLLSSLHSWFVYGKGL